MSSPKIIRGQVRQIAQELLGEELVLAASKELKGHIDRRLDILTKHIQETLDRVDTRSKEVQSYLVRASTPQAPTSKN